MLTGCSAGGLSTFLQADHVGDFLAASAKALKVYKAVPLSGFFLLETNAEEKPVYPDESIIFSHV